MSGYDYGQDSYADARYDEQDGTPWDTDEVRQITPPQSPRSRRLQFYRAVGRRFSEDFLGLMAFMAVIAFIAFLVANR